MIATMPPTTTPEERQRNHLAFMQRLQAEIAPLMAGEQPDHMLITNPNVVHLLFKEKARMLWGNGKFIRRQRRRWKGGRR